MAITLLGMNHRTAPIEVRERLAWSNADLPSVAARILAQGGSGVVVLSTCNRTEFYLSDASPASVHGIWELAAERLGEPAEPHAYISEEREAARHLFRVAAGLDSMILGESEIQGQVRQAWEAAHAYAGPVLGHLFQRALRAGGRVRSETALGAGAASVPSASVELARKILGTLSGRRALVLGSGEMAELAMKCLASEGVGTVLVAHRRMERARDVASRLGGRAVQFDDAWPMFADVDLVLCSTAAPHAVVTLEKIAGTLSNRDGRQLCILDIAVPRDVDPEVGQLENVFLFDIDDLKGVVASNIGTREGEIPDAERIIAEEVALFWEWYGGRGVARAIRALRERAEQIRSAEFRRALKKLEHLSPKDRDRVENLSRALMNKLLHEPTMRLRESVGIGMEIQVTDALRHLLNLQSFDPGDDRNDQG